MFIPKEKFKQLLHRYLGPSGTALIQRAGIGSTPAPEGADCPEGCIYVTQAQMDALWRQVNTLLDPGTAMAFMFGLEALKSSVKNKVSS